MISKSSADTQTAYGQAHQIKRRENPPNKMAGKPTK